jgi:hypothetical protein
MNESAPYQGPSRARWGRALAVNHLPDPNPGERRARLLPAIAVHR